MVKWGRGGWVGAVPHFQFFVRNAAMGKFEFRKNENRLFCDFPLRARDPIFLDPPCVGIQFFSPVPIVECVIDDPAPSVPRFID